MKIKHKDLDRLDVCPHCGSDIKDAPFELVEINGETHRVHTRCAKKKEEKKDFRSADGPMPI